MINIVLFVIGGKMAKIYVYRIVNYNGSAPCCDENLFTLAICKPVIRRVIGRTMSSNLDNDIWIVAINGRNMERQGCTYNSVCYIAKINCVNTFAEYFSSDKYKKRKDCIYQKSNKKTKFRSEDTYFEVIKGNGIHEGKLSERDWDLKSKGEKYVLCSREYAFININYSDCIKAIIGEDNIPKRQGHKVINCDSDKNDMLKKILNKNKKNRIFTANNKGGKCECSN